MTFRPGIDEVAVLKKRPKLTAFERWAYAAGIDDDGSMFMAAAAGWYAARGKEEPDFIRNFQDYEAAPDAP